MEVNELRDQARISLGNACLRDEIIEVDDRVELKTSIVFTNKDSEMDEFVLDIKDPDAARNIIFSEYGVVLYEEKSDGVRLLVDGFDFETKEYISNNLSEFCAERVSSNNPIHIRRKN